MNSFLASEDDAGHRKRMDLARRRAASTTTPQLPSLLWGSPHISPAISFTRPPQQQQSRHSHYYLQQQQQQQQQQRHHHRSRRRDHQSAAAASTQDGRPQRRQRRHHTPPPSNSDDLENYRAALTAVLQPGGSSAHNAFQPDFWRDTDTPHWGLRQKDIGHLESQLQSFSLARGPEAIVSRMKAVAKDRAAAAAAAEARRRAEEEAAMLASQQEEEEDKHVQELDALQTAMVQNALGSGPGGEVLISGFNVDLTRDNMRCLKPRTWLNDEVINFYFQLLKERDGRRVVASGGALKPSLFFPTFFHTKLTNNNSGYKYADVRRWTRRKKIDIFALDKVIMPVHVGEMHWCCAVVFMQRKIIRYWDSMGGSGAGTLKVLQRYVTDELQDKKKQTMDWEGWNFIETTPDTPQQNNGCDCGVFSTMFADYASEDLEFTFSQADMPHFRHRMAACILAKHVP